MHNTLDLIEILDAIVRNGSFEAAAQELHKVRSALTYTVRKYEERLGIKIFDRSKHRAKLTEAGRLLLDHGRHLMTLSYKIEEQVKLIASGWEPIVRLAYDVILSIEPIFDLIKHFQTQCPKISLEIYSEVLGGSADALMEGRVDIAIGVTEPLPSHADLIFEPLGLTEFVFAVSPNHPLALIKEPLSTDQIKEYHALVARDSSLRRTPQSSMLLPDQHRITFSNMELKKQAQIRNLGVGFLPYRLIKEEIKQGKLLIKQVEREQRITYLYIGWNKTKIGKANQWLLNNIKDEDFKKRLLD